MIALQSGTLALGTGKIVVGPGALGAFLAWDLGEKDGVLPVLLGHTERTVTFHIQTKTANASFSAQIFGTAEAIKKASRNNKRLLFYICVPPQVTETIAREIFSVIETLQCDEVTLVFCNNGIVPSEIYKMAENFNTTCVSIFRAIVLAGFERVTKESNVYVTHTGGAEVYFGAVVPDLVPAEEVQHIATGEHLNWTWRIDVLAIEAAKFFVNLVLSFAIGPRVLPNRDSLSALSSEELTELAFHISLLFPDSGVSPKSLEDWFRATVSATPQNTNSVSLAWSRGDTRSVRYFLSTMNTLAERHFGKKSWYSEFEMRFREKWQLKEKNA